MNDPMSMSSGVTSRSSRLGAQGNQQDPSRGEFWGTNGASWDDSPYTVSWTRAVKPEPSFLKRACRWLFVDGGMCAVLIGLLILCGLTAGVLRLL